MKIVKSVKTIKKGQNVPVEFVTTMYIRNKKACTVDRFRAFIPYRYYQNQYCCTREYGQPQPTVHSTTVRTVIEHYYSTIYLLLYSGTLYFITLLFLFNIKRSSIRALSAAIMLGTGTYNLFFYSTLLLKGTVQ